MNQSGTGSVTADAQGLEPGCKQFVTRVMAASARIPRLAELDVVQLRVELERCRAGWSEGGPSMAATEEHWLPVADGPQVRLRVHRPPGLDHPAPALVYLHGGGWTLFSIDTHDRLMREYAARAGCVVIGVDYSLSPEHRFPVALQQVVAVLEWTAQQSRLLGVELAGVFVGGDSAGGNLSVAAALTLRDNGSACQVAGLILNYPVTSSTISAAASDQYGGEGNMLTTEEMRGFWDNYLPEPGARHNPYVAPILADLTHLPPALFVIAECDVLAEQGVALAQAYREAGNATELRVYEGAPHSFLEAVAVSPLADRALQESSDWLSGTAAALSQPGV